MVREKAVEISTPDGVADAFLCEPDGNGPWPGVLHYTDIGGNREVNRDLSKRIAAEGHFVLMPNVFYRSDSPPLFDFPRKSGEPGTMARYRELMEPVATDAMARDAAAYIRFLSQQSNVKPGKIGVVGYCFTGAMALRTAAVRPDTVAAAASFHGGGLYKDDAASPHLVLPRVKAQLYFGHAENDRSMPAEAIAKLEHALETWGGQYESEVYAGAGHGWTMKDSAVYNHSQAERAYEKLLGLLKQTLG